jgi:hypothetical protein
MATPNIRNVTTINGNTATQSVTTSPTSLVSNSVSSNKVYKINTLYISNIDATTTYRVTIDLFRSGVPTRIAANTQIPAATTLDVLSKSIYLLEGDSIRLTADSANKLEAVASWEEIS